MNLVKLDAMTPEQRLDFMHRLLRVVMTAQRVADNFDDEAVGLMPIEQDLVDALKALDEPRYA